MGIIVKDFKEHNREGICLALGYFDSVHIGHASLIEKCVCSPYIPAVFTFSNSPYSLLGGVDEQVFTYDERLRRLEKLGVQMCVSAQFDKAFMDMEASTFLDKLIDNLSVKKVVIGQDYTCGKFAKFRSIDVQKYLETRNVECEILPLLNSKYGKVASSTLKVLIKQGDIEAINSLLPINYSVSGTVEHGRKEGARLLGFPTANISFHKDKLLLKEGVYHTKIAIYGVYYDALTNVGNHPTFYDYNYNLESYILNFDGMIYNEYIDVEFIARLRDTIKFNSIEELKQQIMKDIRRIEQCQ